MGDKLAIDTTPLKPKLWKRYVDDTFVVWEHGLESELTLFLEHLNGVIYNIPCTCGREYIDETGRNLWVKIGEHKYAIQRGNMSNAIVVHVHEIEHPIDREGKTLCM